MGKATIYDLARVCASFEKCNKCILLKFCAEQRNMFSNDIDKANEIILNWCKEHPVETRQDRFLKMFPKARMCNGVIDICPIKSGGECSIGNKCCSECKKEYWLAEVEDE